MAEQFLSAFVSNISELVKYSLMKFITFEDRMLTTLVTTVVGTILSLFSFTNLKSLVTLYKNNKIRTKLSEYHKNEQFPKEEYIPHYLTMLEKQNEEQSSSQANHQSLFYTSSVSGSTHTQLILYVSQMINLNFAKTLQQVTTGSDVDNGALLVFSNKYGQWIPIIVNSDLKILFVRWSTPYLYAKNASEATYLITYIREWVAAKGINYKQDVPRNYVSIFSTDGSDNTKSNERTDSFKTFDTLVSIHKPVIKKMVDMLITGGYDKNITDMLRRILELFFMVHQGQENLHGSKQ